MSSPNDKDIVFYNGSIKLHYDDKRHIYTRDGDRVAGVSSVVKILDKSNALVPWAAKKVCEKILSTMPTMEDDPPHVVPIRWKEFVQLVESAKWAHKEIKEDAADIGKQAHKILENDVLRAIKYNNGKVDTEDQFAGTMADAYDDRVINCVLSAYKWMDDHKVIWKAAEKVVYSRELNYAGTTDGLALVSSCEESNCCLLPFSNILSIIDYKSGNGIYGEALLQTAAYMKAHLEEYPDQLISDRWILRLGKEEGDFDKLLVGPEHFVNDFQAFKLCLQLSDIMKKVDARVPKKKPKKKIKETDWLDQFAEIV